MRAARDSEADPATSSRPRASLSRIRTISRKAAPPRVRSGVTPLAVRDVDVRAGLDQQPHDLGMHRPAVAEDHGFEQRGPAELVDVILVDRGAEQDAHRLRVAVMRGRDQRRAAVAVGAFQVGAGRQRHFQDLDAAFGARIEIGAVLDIVLGVHVGAGRDQRARDRDVIAVGRGEQRRAAAAVARRDARALADQPLDGREIALRRPRRSAPGRAPVRRRETS